MKPYKLITDEPGRADVIDRVTGRKVGYVLFWSNGWSAYLSCAAGHELEFGERVLDDKLREVFHVDRLPMFTTRYRKVAAERVWRRWKELQDA